MNTTKTIIFKRSVQTGNGDHVSVVTSCPRNTYSTNDGSVIEEIWNKMNN
uniref:Uncharacterized protein n=1 Tax=Arion vulgaris TaxID=1028688 RepID=A0A0B7B8H0_9EUPU